MAKLFGLDDVLASENKTLIITSSILKGVTEHYPEIVDVLFKLPYYVNVNKFDDAETPKGAFQTYCYDHYIQSPYTFLTIYDLYQKGYYIEATVLIRHVLEIFIQMRYFEKYPESLEEYLIGKKRFSFKAMFDEFSEDYYKRYYGHILSSFAHGKVAKSIFRIERKSQEDSRIIMGCQFNLDHATFVMNNTIPIIYGFLNFFERFFPNHKLGEDILFSTNLDQSKAWLIMYMEGHKKENPRSHEWYKHIDRFVNPEL